MRERDTEVDILKEKKYVLHGNAKTKICYILPFFYLQNTNQRILIRNFVGYFPCRLGTKQFSPSMNIYIYINKKTWK